MRDTTKTYHLLKKLGKIFTLLVAVIGILVLLGWGFDLEVLRRPTAGLVSMNPLTAICFILSASSLFLQTLKFKTEAKQKLGYGFALLVFAAGGLKIGGLIFNIDMHIDSWLFSSKLDAEIVGNVINRMAPNTALGFLLTGLSLLLLNKKGRTIGIFSQCIVALVCLVGMLSLLGYLYQVKIFYGFLSYIPMAVHTALCFLLLSLAIIFAHPEKGIMGEFTRTQVGRITASRLIPSALIIPTLLGLSGLYLEFGKMASPEMVISLFVLGNIIIFFVLIWVNIRELNKKDDLRREAEEQLTKANKELEAFSYSVSHDLRAPLRAVNGYAKALQEDYTQSLDGDAKRVIGAIASNGEKMGILIDDLLAFSKLGRKEIQKANVNMNVLTAEIIAEIGRNIHNQAKMIVGDLSEVAGDYALLHQVVYNLIANAVKYSSKKENPVIHISSEKTSNGVVFTVKDNGAGFDMKYADKLFGTFQRLHGQNEFEGIGIGLAIVHRIVTKHGGKVWAEGEVGTGASFYFSLP